MCQLLGMNCAQKTSHSFDFSGFRLRGGKTDKHSHGFGVAFHQGNAVKTIIDASAAATSPIAELVSKCPMKTKNMISHIRYATCERRQCKTNAHPFQCKLWGTSVSFAHSGDVPKFSSKGDNNPIDFPLLGKARKNDIHYKPVGETDSELAFCAIMNALKAEFQSRPPMAILHKIIKDLCDEIVSSLEENSTIFNMLLA